MCFYQKHARGMVQNYCIFLYKNKVVTMVLHQALGAKYPKLTHSNAKLQKKILYVKT